MPGRVCREFSAFFAGIRTQRYLFKASVSEEAPYLFEVSFRFVFSRKSPSGIRASLWFFHWYVFKVSSFPRVKGVVLEGGSDVSCSHKKYVFFATTTKRATAKESNIR